MSSNHQQIPLKKKKTSRSLESFFFLFWQTLKGRVEAYGKLLKSKLIFDGAITEAHFFNRVRLFVSMCINENVHEFYSTFVLGRELNKKADIKGC